MLEDLQNARTILSAALDRYISVCSAIVIGDGPRHTLKSISQEILDTVQKERDFIASYHTKLTHAQAMVDQQINIIPTLTPIHALPSDILAYIFQLVRDAQPDYLSKDLTRFSLAYPETLTYVCSHWRQIAINSRSLWSHIQISDCYYAYSYHNTLFARAKVFAARADPSPVDIRIISNSYGYYDDSLNDFFASVATRIRTFEISATSFNNARISGFQRWLANCKPGSLSELALRRSSTHTTFERIEASESPVGSTSLLLEMPHGYLEAHLHPIKVLHLTGIYFQWASRAYHGLVELRLFPIIGGENIAITQSQLKAILTASPRLRELYFGLQIMDVLPHTDSRVAVRLDDLEVVNMCSMKGVHYGPLLQLLAPGPKPLQLSVNCRHTNSLSFLGDDIIKFFARSNVAKLHIESFNTDGTNRHQPLVLLELLKHLPTLQALSLRRFYLGSHHPGCQPQDREPSSQVGTERKSYPTSPLDIVHFRDCTIDLDYLRGVIQNTPVQKVKYKGCQFYSMMDGYSSQDPGPRDDLSSTFSSVHSSWPLDELDPWA